ncbi:MAG: ATP-binding protein, partial [Vicinamibacterales bacterium]
VGYVLADRSAAGLTPLAWARQAADAAREFGAVKIVAESNQGGEMVRQTLVSAGVTCAVELVHASKGKRARAEPWRSFMSAGLSGTADIFRPSRRN